MEREGQLLDKKSLRIVTGSKADWYELAKDCIEFANASGGRLLLGIEDGHFQPPSGQRVQPELLDIIRRRIADLTVNVTTLPDIRTSATGDQYIEMVIPRSISVASTTDGRYFIRVAD